MSGQMKNFRERKKELEAYLDSHDIYNPVPKGPIVDLRGYAAFVKDNNLKWSDITPDIESKFIVRK